MKKKILLVDDTETVLMTEKLMLAGQNFDVSVARNGLDALERISSEPPDLVLLDVVMPILNGIETCKKLKDNPDTAGIPVLIVTTKGEPENVEKAMLAGCDDFLTKPFDKVDLLDKIRTHL